jgi:hypothetical protein
MQAKKAKSTFTLREFSGKNMTELSHWNDVIVPQRYQTGCIPTGYEWLTRYLGIEGVELDTFQEDFDLQRAHQGMNSFVPIADKIRSRYPFINIHTECFDHGLEKVEAMKNLIERDVPCLISLALRGFRTSEGHVIERGWHIMPVVRIDDRRITMIHKGTENRNARLELLIATIVSRHNDLEGGKDISWIENKNKPSHDS